MRHLTWIFLLLPFSALFAVAQEPVASVNPQGIVESVEISGVPEGDISPALRGTMQKLAGAKFDQQATEDLVQQIEIELPGFIATTKLVPGVRSDRVKVIFVIERINEEQGKQSNVNSRYTVEKVELQGIDESRLSRALRDDMQKLIGEKLDQEAANRIRHRLQLELQPRWYVVKKVMRGSRPQQVVVIYEVRKTFWIPFIDLSPHIVYHSKENFSASLDVPIKISSSRFTVGIVDDADQLLERFAGYRLGYENVKVGTERLGIGLHYASYHDRWQPATSSALPKSPELPGIYRERRSFDPSITFAFDPKLKLTAGAGFSELETQYPAIHSENSNVGAASLNFRGVWERSDGDKHEFDGTYDLRAAAHNLDSDFIYTRHFGRAQYVYRREKSKLTISFLSGRISGRAPLFERFSLGNASTLRGWNKFDVAPLGGNRVIHGSLQYGLEKGIGQFTNDTGEKKRIQAGFYVFYDTGAVGDRGLPIKARHSVGLGLGQESFFFSVGFPIRSSRVQPTFIMEFRF